MTEKTQSPRPTHAEPGLQIGRRSPDGSNEKPATGSLARTMLALQATAGNSATTSWLSGREGVANQVGFTGNQLVASRIHDGSNHVSVQRDSAPSKESADHRYTRVHEHVGKFFGREQTLASALVRRKRDALDRFAQKTDANYNKEADSSAFALFSLALMLVPEAGALLGVFQVMTKGTKYFLEISEGAKLLGERVKASNEAIKGAVEVGKGVGEVKEAGEKQRATSDAESRGNFIMLSIDNLTKLEEETISSFWKNEDEIMKQLDSLLEKGVDLDSFLETHLPIPQAVPSDAGEKVSYRFELLLYKQLYADPGMRKKRTASYLDLMGDTPLEEWIEGWDLPEKMLKHITGDIEKKVPNALEIVFGAQYAQTTVQTQKRQKEQEKRQQQVRDAQFQEGMEEKFLGL